MAARTRRTSGAISVTQTLQDSFISNNPTSGSTAELPWWLTGGIQAGTTLATGGSWQDALCASTGICLDSGAPSSGALNKPLQNPCPTGYVFRNGRCEKTGFEGAIERFLPGGDTGVLGPDFGPAVMGAFGKPALVPAQVAQPTLRCPAGLVLGKDNLCYPKSSITRSDRKWKPAPRPPISARDAAAIRRADRAKTRVKRLAMKSGFTCRKR